MLFLHDVYSEECRIIQTKAMTEVVQELLQQRKKTSSIEPPCLHTARTSGDYDQGAIQALGDRKLLRENMKGKGDSV